MDAFAKTAFLKLNGGLGTSMGLDKAKSLLPVRRHKAKQMRFIDIIIGQVLTARTRLNVELPLTFMNSFHTSADTMKRSSIIASSASMTCRWKSSSIRNPNSWPPPANR